MTAAIVLIASAYGLAGLLLLLKRSRSGLALFTLGTVVNWGLMCWEWWFSGHPPLANMSHVLVFLGGVFGPLYLGFAIPRGMAWLAPLFPFAAGVPLLISLTMERDELWRLMPALQSPWFVPHVASYMVSYALAALAFFLNLLAVYKDRAGRQREALACDNASRELARFALPLMTFGMISGALWAEEAWGRYWSWDAKETWSLITWCLYLIYLHCCLHPRLQPWRRVAQTAAFLALLATFFLVNLLPKMGSILHSYA